MILLSILPALCAAQVIPTVVVSPQKAHYSSTHAHKTVITRDAITATGATSLAHVLQTFGGVQLQDMTGNGSQVALSLRGFGANASSNTLLLINGIPITNPDLAPPNLNAIPLQEIEFIEITSGSESVLYGDQAVGGTINIVTRKPTEKTITELSCGYGSYHQKNCTASTQGQLKNVNLSLAGRIHHTDNYRQHNDYDQKLVTGAITYPYATGSVAFDFQAAHEHMLYPGELTATQVAENPRQAKNFTDFFQNNNGLYHLQHQQTLNNNWHLQTDFARRDMHGDGVLSSTFTQSRVIHFIKPQLKGLIGKAIFTGGIDFEEDHYDLKTKFGDTDNNQEKYSVFVLLNYPYDSRLSFSIGARGGWQHLDDTQHASATTLGATYQLQKDSKIYLRRAESFRFPKADENTGVNLKPQQGVSYEMGIEWQWKKLLSTFSLYQLNLNNEITFDPTQTPEQPFGSNRNLDPTVRRGLSFSEKYPLTDQLELAGQYHFVNARFQSGANSGNRIPSVAENILHFGANYHFMQHWKIYSEAIYTGNQYSANDDANMAGKIGGYTVYNLHLSYQIKQFSAGLRFNNIFNKYYNLYTVYQSYLAEQFFYPAAGRNFLLTMKYDFS